MSLLQMSVWGSAIILLTAFIRVCALNRLPKRAFVALWMLAAVRMLLPYTLPCPVSMQTMTRHALSAPPIQGELPGEDHAAVAPSSPEMPAAQPMRKAKRVEIPVVQIIYLGGVAACILIIGIPHLRWRRIYAQALPARGERIQRWKQDRGIGRRVKVCVSDRIAAPLTTGLIRPRILLPAGAEAWDADRLTYVLEHEWTHIRHGDVARKGILAAAVCVHWFNPLAWLMFILASRDMELACDEAIIRRFGVDARAGYATTLIDLTAERSHRRDSLVSAFSFPGIEERIGSIMRMKKKSWLSVLLALVLVMSTAAVFATTAEENSTEQGTLNAQEQSLLRKYSDLGLDCIVHGDSEEYALEMHYDGKPVHSVWDPQAGILIQNSMNGFYLGDDAIDLIVEYENGQPSQLRVDDDREDHMGKHISEISREEFLSLLQPDGWEEMTISEYQRLLWMERDNPESMAALQSLSSDPEFYESRGSDAGADYYFNIYEPLTASQWQTRSWDGAARSVQDGHVRMEYSLFLTILDADSLTVGEYDDARASMLAELNGILEKHAEQDEDALRASVEENIGNLSGKYGGDALEIRVEYVLDVEKAEQAETTAPDDQEPRTYAPATEEQYASLLAIMPEEQDTVADFNRALLAWCDEDYERMERVFQDAGRDDFHAPLTEAQRRFVQLTAVLSGEENALRVQSGYTGLPLEDPVLEGGDFWKQSEDGLCWSNLWYQFSYHIADPETLTVGERDLRVSGMLADIEDFWNEASLDDLLSGVYDVKKVLEDIADKYSDDEMTLTIDPERVFFERYDNRNRG